MQKAILLAQKISKQLDSDCSELVEEYNLHKQFEPIFNLKTSNVITNTLICAIIYAYDSDSKWADLRKTSYEDKVIILNGLDATITEPLFDEFIKLTNDEINRCIGNFLDIQGDWKVSQVRRSRDYHSETIMRQSNSTDAKEQEQIGKLLREGINQRKISDDYMRELETDRVLQNHRTKQDFGIEYTEFATKKDILSWRTFITDLNEKKKAALS